MQQKQIYTSKIDPNIKNPRRIDIAKEDLKLGSLMDSIKQFGILVPLVVVPNDGRYMLIDGERRYEVAKSLRLKTVPAYIIEEDLSKRDVLLRMFHIHHNREQWDPIPQCIALESMYNGLNNRNKIRSIVDEEAKIKTIATEIEQRTGLDDETARDRILFLRWPQDVKNRLYKKPTGEYHHIVEIEKGIILPALKNYPEYFDKVDIDDVRRFLLEKIKVNVTRGIEVRTASAIVKFKTHTKSEKRKVLRILNDLVKDKNMTYQEAREEFDREFPNANAIKPLSPRKLLTWLLSLIDKIEMFSMDSFSIKTKRSRASKTEVADAIGKLESSLRNLKRKL